MRPYSDLRALVVIANPRDLARYEPNNLQLAEIDVDAELERVEKGLAGIRVVTLCRKDRATFDDRDDRPTLNNVLDRLRDEPDILYLVCHGALIDGLPMLWLEDEEGWAKVTAADEVVDRLRRQTCANCRDWRYSPRAKVPDG